MRYDKAAKKNSNVYNQSLSFKSRYDFTGIDRENPVMTFAEI